MLSFIQQLSVTTRIVLICAVALLVGGFLALDALTDFDPGPYLQLATIGLGCFGVGVATASGPVARGGGGAVLLMLALSSQACAPCVAEQAVVSALDVGLTAADEAVGDDGGDDWDQALSIARGTSLLGAAAVEACELARDGAGWQAWVGLALEAAVGVAAHFGGAGDPAPSTPPAELTAAISALTAEIQ